MDFYFPGQGKLTMKFEPADGGEVFEYTVFDAPSEGIAWECIIWTNRSEVLLELI